LKGNGGGLTRSSLEKTGEKISLMSTPGKPSMTKKCLTESWDRIQMPPDVETSQANRGRFRKKLIDRKGLGGGYAGKGKFGGNEGRRGGLAKSRLGGKKGSGDIDHTHGRALVENHAGMGCSGEKENHPYKRATWQQHKAVNSLKVGQHTAPSTKVDAIRWGRTRSPVQTRDEQVQESGRGRRSTPKKASGKKTCRARALKNVLKNRG